MVERYEYEIQDTTRDKIKIKKEENKIIVKENTLFY